MTMTSEEWSGAGSAVALPFRSESIPDVRPDPAGARMLQLGEERVLLASAAMEQLRARVQHAARVPVPVLLMGETGSGKEWLAHAVHLYSPRAERPFKVLNCGSIPPSLTEATLFGSERGAFTGALKTSKGVFEQARGGTVFLDELGELPLAAQASLLRVLDGQPFTRIGGTEEIRPDIRLVAATNRDLAEMVAEGTFREDLYYRLSTVALRVPALRERREEIAPLSRLFLQRASRRFGRAIGGICPELVDALEDYAWPGNIRQLRNVIDSAVLRCQGTLLTSEDVPADFFERNVGRAPEVGEQMRVDPTAADYRTQVRAFETALILAALRRTAGNQRKAAVLLGLPHRTLVHKIRCYDIRKVYKA